MRVLVTGITGQLGTAIATHLLEAGFEVIGLSRRASSLAGLKQQILLDIATQGVTEEIRRQVRSCEAIVHTAASLDMHLYAPSVALVNCLGLQEILKLANDWCCTNFIYLSSVPIIGRPQVLPVTEEHPVNPLTAYHASKLFGEQLVELARQQGLSGTIFRLTAPVGPGTPKNRVLSVFVQQALANKPLVIAGQGSRRQNYVDVRDVAQAVEQCLLQNVTGLYNIAGSQAISNLELAQSCIEILKSNSILEFSGQPDAEEGVIWEVSIAKAAKRFGYWPHYDIRAAIEAVAQDYAYSLH